MYFYKTMISEDLLKQYGATLKSFSKGEALFLAQEEAYFYYQVQSGSVKMNNYNRDGKEFIQGIFTNGESFGEPPLFSDFPYPANAEAMEDSVLWRLGKNYFLKLLEENPAVHIKFTRILSNRLHYKAVMVSEISNESAEHRILALIDYLKSKTTHELAPFQYEVEMTRQQIADLTGMRVETVIRTIKKLEKEGKIEIKNRKVFR